jgi:hypothetical protein
LILLILIVAIAAVGYAAWQEIRTSRLQSREFSKLASTLTYHSSPAPATPSSTPVTALRQTPGLQRLGEFLPRLLKRDYLINQQVRFSPALMNYAEHGLFVPYVEKIQAGLSITDCRGDTLYQYNYPQHLYRTSRRSRR